MKPPNVFVKCTTSPSCLTNFNFRGKPETLINAYIFLTVCNIFNLQFWNNTAYMTCYSEIRRTHVNQLMSAHWSGAELMGASRNCWYHRKISNYHNSGEKKMLWYKWRLSRLNRHVCFTTDFSWFIWKLIDPPNVCTDSYLTNIVTKQSKQFKRLSKFIRYYSYRKVKSYNRILLRSNKRKLVGMTSNGSTISNCWIRSKHYVSNRWKLWKTCFDFLLLYPPPQTNWLSFLTVWRMSHLTLLSTTWRPTSRFIRYR